MIAERLQRIVAISPSSHILLISYIHLFLPTLTQCRFESYCCHLVCPVLKSAICPDFVVSVALEVLQIS